MEAVGRSARSGLGVGVVLLSLAALCGFSAARPEATSAARPNVLVIVTDDQRAGTLNAMPNTSEWFRASGRRFPHAFVTTPLCCPSRASIFTGQYAHNHKIKKNGSASSLLPHARTVQSYLDDAGYATRIVGKFLNGWPSGESPPYFDRWAIMRRSNQYLDAEFNVNGTVSTVPGYTTNVISDSATRMLLHLERRDGKPWLLYVAPNAPHPPATPDTTYADARVPPWTMSEAVIEGDRSDKPPWVLSTEVSPDSMRLIRARQFRTLMSVDDLVGTLASTLRSLGERRRTIAFFLSDNGFLWGEHGLRGKEYPYTQSIKTPLFLSWPGRVPADSKDGRFATNVDLAPTILDAADVAPRRQMDGRSLLRDWGRDHVFMEYWRNAHARRIRSWESVRTKGLQYVEYYNERRSQVVFREYYSLAKDPLQLDNLLHDGNPGNDPSEARLARLRRMVRQDRHCLGSTCP
jgi:arylsulfatase A-like enzyme